MHNSAIEQMLKGGAEVGQCLTFLLFKHLYAVPILTVQEIRRYSAPTPLPNAPSYVLGLINLRGNVIPVFDLRLRFGQAAPTYDRQTVIIIAKVDERHVGVVADDVVKVLAMNREAVRPPPPLAAHIDTSFVQCLLRDGDVIVTLFDVNKLLRPELETLDV